MLIAYLPKEKILFTADFNVPGAGAAGQPVDRDARPEHRAAAARLRTARDGARAQPRPPDDQGRSAGAGEGNQLKWTRRQGGRHVEHGRSGDRPLALSLAGVATLTAPLLAHHSFAATYLEADTIEVEGNVSQFEFKNPHSWIYVHGPGGLRPAEDLRGRVGQHVAARPRRHRQDDDPRRRQRPHLGIAQPGSERQPGPPEANRAPVGWLEVGSGAGGEPDRPRSLGLGPWSVLWSVVRPSFRPFLARPLFRPPSLSELKSRYGFRHHSRTERCDSSALSDKAQVS